MFSTFLKLVKIVLLINFINSEVIFSESINEKIVKISDNIWQTTGTLFPKPEIKILDIQADLKNIKTLIYYSPKENNIHISTGFAKICLSISEDALAIALAHEIGHYFNLHRNTVTLSGYYLTENETIIMKELGFEDRTNYYELETQADIFAAFHCLISGYDIDNAWDKLIDTVYSNSENIEIRQSINDRKKIAKFAITKVKSIQSIYKVAKFNYLIGEYEMAANCYEFLLNNSINSIEIYFNLANSYSKAAINSDEIARRFIYPFEMRDFTILDSNYSRTDSPNSERGLSKPRYDLDDYQNLMKSKALLNYNFLIVQKNSQNLQLYLAISALYNFAGETKSARAYLIKAEELSKTKHDSNLVQLTKGLLYMNIDPDLAELELSKAQDFLPAKHNLNIIKNIKAKNKKDFKFFRINEHVNEVDVTNLEVKLKAAEDKDYQIGKISFNIKKFENDDCNAFKIENEFGKAFFIETSPIYKGYSVRNVRIGSNVNNLNKQYGLPDNIIFWNKSTYYIYNLSRIAFEIDRNNKIRSWIIFLNE